jgi:hypothetical protein
MEELLEIPVMTSALASFAGSVLAIGDGVRNIVVDLVTNHQTLLDKNGVDGLEIYGAGIAAFIVSGGTLAAISHMRERRQNDDAIEYL